MTLLAIICLRQSMLSDLKKICSANHSLESEQLPPLPHSPLLEHILSGLSQKELVDLNSAPEQYYDYGVARGLSRLKNLAVEGQAREGVSSCVEGLYAQSE